MVEPYLWGGIERLRSGSVPTDGPPTILGFYLEPRRPATPLPGAINLIREVMTGGR